MPRTLFLFLASLLLATSLQAQSESADLSVEFEFEPEEHLTTSVFGTWVRIRNAGPSTARGLVITAEAPGASEIEFWQTRTYCNAATCTTTFGDLEPGNYVEFSAGFRLPAEIETTIPLTVRVSSATPDPNAANNVVTQDQLFLAVAQLDADVSIRYENLEPELPTEVTFGVNNRGRAASVGTAVELTLPDGSEVLSVTPPAGVTCTNDATHVRCEIGTLHAHTGVAISVFARTPAAAYAGGSFPLEVRASATNRVLESRLSRDSAAWYFQRLYVVDNTADSGPGSLRQALTDANALCGKDGCRIGFRIHPSAFENGAATIRPMTPLPAIRDNVRIDGNSEKFFVGTPKLDHPLVQLDGAKLTAGDGLQLLADGSSVGGLAISNFPGVGVTLQAEAQQTHVRGVTDCFIGTDATGQIAMPNERGVMVIGVRYGVVERNLISGNRHSGLWLIGTYFFTVARNRIGIAADGLSPLPNGASGIYITALNERPVLFNNTIAYNVQFGIALDRSLRQVNAVNNSIYGNGNLGIDYGLDLATPNAEVDLGRQPNTPVMTSAVYDPARDITRIEGDLNSYAEAPPLGNRFLISLYANDSANAQAQRRIADLITPGGHFFVELKGDLRGKYITGITLRYRKGLEGTLEEYVISEETSEIGAPILVQ